LFKLIEVIFLIPLTVLYSSFSWGYVATIISAWFIIPLFPQMPIFTCIQFAGIMFFANCFIRSTSSNIKKEYKDSSGDYITTFLSPWLILLEAWILHLFY